MDATVWIAVISIYVGAGLAPLGVWAAARRTGHGPQWQVPIVICGAVIWLILGLAFVQQFLGVTFFEAFLERVAVLGIIALAVLSVVGFLIAMRPWPDSDLR